MRNVPDGLGRRVREKAGRVPGPARARRRGFTLIETALATVIIGVGVLALVDSQTAFIKSNAWSTHAATATYLANEIREMTRRMPKHDAVTGLYLQGAAGNQTLRGWGPETGEASVEDFDDVDDFDGLRLSYNGTAGLSDGDLPGPIDGFGQIIPQIDVHGTVTLDGEGNAMPLQGWTQEITVNKVSPTNYSTVVADSAVVAADNSGFNGVAVDQFPLRVTVQVKYRGVYDTQDTVIAEVSWIVP